MTEKEWKKVGQQIGYNFKNISLLKQAFTRKSYTNETHDGENNEVLEFIGDKALDLIIVMELSDKYGKVNRGGEFVCQYDEGKLTEMKKKLVESKSLAQRIDHLKLAQYLVMGKGDRMNNAQEDTHVKEDLFEAIIGAVAIDSDWDMDAVQRVVDSMLQTRQYYKNPESHLRKSYTDMVQQWWQLKFGESPRYDFHCALNRTVTEGMALMSNSLIEGGVGKIAGQLDYADLVFVGRGNSNTEAREVTAELFYKFLTERCLLVTKDNEMSEAKPETAVSRLQEIAQRGYITMPEYEYKESHDGNGNPEWLCICIVEGFRNEHYQAQSKKEAKRMAAYTMLIKVLRELER